MRLEVGQPLAFQGNNIPAGTKLAGLSALVHALAIRAPVRQLSCVSENYVRGTQKREGPWTVFDKRYWPGDTLAGHLTFAVTFAFLAQITQRPVWLEKCLGDRMDDVLGILYDRFAFD
jgi:hypothetical protein